MSDLSPGVTVAIPCRKSADVAFVIDATYNVNYQDFQQHVLATVQDIVRSLDVDSGKVRVAAVQYASQAKVRRLHERCPIFNDLHCGA